jgi:hypothetical protein
MIAPADRNRAMTDALRTAGSLTDARVQAAMLATPRHLFAPACGWLSLDHQAEPGRAIHRGTDPDDWWTAVYSHGSIITQRDDGAAVADSPSGTPTSSLSAPGVVAQFLELLDARPRDRARRRTVLRQPQDDRLLQCAWSVGDGARGWPTAHPTTASTPPAPWRACRRPAWPPAPSSSSRPERDSR